MALRPRYLARQVRRDLGRKISATGRKDYRSPEGIRVAPAAKLLADLA